MLKERSSFASPVSNSEADHAALKARGNPFALLLEQKNRPGFLALRLVLRSVGFLS